MTEDELQAGDTAWKGGRYGASPANARGREQDWRCSHPARRSKGRLKGKV